MEMETRAMPKLSALQDKAFEGMNSSSDTQAGFPSAGSQGLGSKYRQIGDKHNVPQLLVMKYLALNNARGIVKTGW